MIPGPVIGMLITAFLRGSMYGLFALGLAISFGMLDIVHVSHPTFVFLAAYSVIFISEQLGTPAWLSLLFLVPLFFCVGYGLYLFLRETVGGVKMSIRGLVFFFGLILILQVLMLYVFGSQWASVDTIWSGTTTSLGITTVRTGFIVIFISTLVIFSAYYLFLQKTYHGLATRAVAQNEYLAKLSGISPKNTKAIGFGISLVFAAIAGYFWGGVTPFNPFTGITLLGLAFAIVVLGGMGSILGCWVAGIVISMVEGLVGYFYNPGLIIVIPFTVIILVFFLKPTGLFGKGFRL